MEQKGFKSFNKGMINRYGKVFKEGEIFSICGSVKFGNNGNGFHFCKRLEDTLRYFPGIDEEIDIAKVTALGNIEEYNDEYNGYFDMFCTDIIRIDKLLVRDEIIDMFLHNVDFRVIRFIQGFKLTKEEIDKFKTNYYKKENILDAIKYYQEKDLDVYKKKYKVKKK